MIPLLACLVPLAVSLAFCLLVTDWEDDTVSRMPRWAKRLRSALSTLEKDGA